MKFCLLLLACLPLAAQTMVLTPSCTLPSTCTSTTITEYSKAATAGATTFTVRPPKTLITITNSGGGTLTWTAALGGTLSTACTNGYNVCFWLTGEFNGTQVTSGGTGVVALNWNPHSVNQLAAGAYTGTITFTPNVGSPQVISVTLNIAAVTTSRETNSPFNGYPSGCSASSVGNSYSDTCAISNNGTLAVPAICSLQMDANFGGRYKRITATGYTTEYGGMTAFSALGTYVIVSTVATGVLSVIKVSDCSAVPGSGGSLPGNLTVLWMSKTDDQVYYYANNAQIRKFNFITMADTLLGNYAGGIYGFTTLYSGGSLSATRDNWIAFTDYGYPASGSDLLCAVNLPQLEADGAPATTNSYCRNIQTDGVSAIDLMGVLDTDTSGLRFVYAGQSPAAGTRGAGFYTIGTPGLLDVWVRGPSYPERNGNDDQSPCSTSSSDCFSSGHYVTVRDRSGNALLFGRYEGVPLNENYFAFWKLSAGYAMMRPLEEPNGGMRFSQRQFPYGASIDMQPGSCDNGAISAALYGSTGIHNLGTSGNVWAARVTAMTAANPPVITVTNPLPIGTQAILIAGATGGTFSSCANGLWPAAVVNSSTSITLTGATCAGAGTYTASSAIAGDGADSTFTSAINNYGQIIVIIPGQTIRQVVMHRSVGWMDVPGSSITAYGTTPKASFSPKCEAVAYNSNLGTLDPNGTAVYVAYTGLTSSSSTTTLRRGTLRRGTLR